MNMSIAEHSQPSSRVIILLDLDCFYAQCESVRLSLSPSLPLCLLQWNSALAVNYPARERFGLKRGAKFEEIQEKSNGLCVALHLPVVSTADIQEKDEHEEDASVEIAYEREFNLPTDQKRKIFLKEKNKMRNSGEGKASLDRYRLASARIFQVMLEALETHVGKNNFILEKASIDELYLDITKHCFKEDEGPAWEVDGSDGAELEEKSFNETCICAKEKIGMPDSHDAEQRALWRGCVIARGLREAVFERLGFTLSAGVSTSKLVAKLGGSLGKPNGQAVIFPEAIPHLMAMTKLKKARNLGGKIGSAVQNLLPPDKDTMGAIAHLLSLNELSTALGSKTGREVWNAARGIDEEPVRETKRALTKSITSFKSFTVRSVEDVPKWIALLAADLFTRVKADTSRNNRHPTMCTVQYYYRQEAQRDRIGKSTRIPFPRQYGTSDLDVFCTRIKELLETKLDLTRIVRLGLCAVSFQDIAKNSIGTFFRKQPCLKRKTDLKSASQTRCESSMKTSGLCSTKIVDIVSHTSIGAAKRANRNDNNDRVQITDKEQITVKSETGQNITAEEKGEADMQYAKKLQALYDRENIILTSSANSNSSGHSKGIRSKSPGSHKTRIDNYFLKRE